MSANALKIVLAQLHLKVGISKSVIEHNCDQIRSAYIYGAENDCDIVLCPELAISGYVPGDLLLREDVQSLLDDVTDSLCDELLEKEKGPAIIFGATRRVYRENEEQYFKQGLHSKTTLDEGKNVLANAAIIVDPATKTVSEVYKKHLPNWGVFDEVRWFAAASRLADPIEIASAQVGVAVCRDIWKEDTVKELSEQGAQIILVPNASPYANARHEERLKAISLYAKKYDVAIMYVNMIQGCDENICEGGSFGVDRNGNIICEAKRFEKDFVICEINLDSDVSETTEDVNLQQADQSGSLRLDVFYEEEAYKTIVLGVKEFIDSIGENTKVVIGLSGGVDSALVAAIAVDALGADRVEGVLLPSKFTSQESKDYALDLASRLNIKTRTIPISSIHDFIGEELSLNEHNPVASENVQSRLRGIMLMMLSNTEGLIPLATSNKSESAVGYFTLYGDSVGAYSPIKDLYKTQVYKVCKWRNSSNDFELSEPIPNEIIDRPPTAELREDQTDEESLLPYDVLDKILINYIDGDMSIDSIVATGIDRSDVKRIVSLVNANEFKRQQSPIGPRLSRKNFGKGRRIPISAKI